MEVIYGLIPSVIIVGILVVLAIIWAAKKGQFDDLDGAGSRILMSDDDKPFADP
ncbi:MAG: cytochrome oxidase maturation protein, cbb3-type, partial [Thiotrichales bacterium 17-46-47]